MSRNSLSLEERIQRLEDIHQIQNLIGRDRYGGMVQYAQKTPGVTIEVAHWGVFEGSAGMKKLANLTASHKEDPKGLMFMHPLTTPVIEVAGDGKTAKGVWISPGHETGHYAGELRAVWAWVKYGIDFVKEDGEWRIWHLHVFAILRCPYEKSWVEAPNVDTDPIPDEFRADKPTTYDHPYSTTTIQELVPSPPEPYDTWNPKDSYGPPEDWG